MSATRSSRIFFIGNRFLIAYLAFLGAFAPLSTDMYLPALPRMAEKLAASNELVGYTISFFLFFFAFSMLVWGPLSDKYGRRPILIAGSLIFVFSSAAIALSDSITSILIGRCVQACGAGAMSAISLTIVRDVMRGSLMEKIVSMMQAVGILAPMLAPVIGGVLLYFTSWCGIFWCLAICGLLALAGALLLKETSPCGSDDSIFIVFSRIGKVLQIRAFLWPLLLFSAMAMPFMSYLGVSTFIYQDWFDTSPQGYSMFFAFNAAISILGPCLHIAVFRHFKREAVISGHLFAMFFFGLVIIFFGKNGPWFYALLFAPITFCGAALRPPATIIMMQAIHRDNGVVASLINCGGLLFGSLSMLIAQLNFWPNPVLATGFISAVISGLCVFGWNLLVKQNKANRVHSDE